MTDPSVFLCEFTRERAETVSERSFGFIVRSMQRFADSHDHNAAWVVRPDDPAGTIAAIEHDLADIGYRRIEVADPALTPELAAALTAAGYEREDQLLMTWRRPPDPDRPDTAGVTVLTLAQRIEVADRVWGEAFGQDDPAVRRELAERARTAVNAARCTFLGVVGDDGVVQASCDLFVRGDTAQVEEVSTLTPFRGRGNASRLVRAAVDRALAAGVRTVFLVAATDDWPRRLYARLGFEATGARTVWSRRALDG